MDAKTRDDLLKLFEGKLNEAMRFYLETCTRCGVCTEACHVHASMGQVKYIAAYRGEIVRRLYKKYFKGQGKLWSSLGEAKELSEMALEELSCFFHQLLFFCLILGHDDLIFWRFYIMLRS